MKKTWFPRKKMGFGWGFPNTWQGLLVLLGYFALAMGGVKLMTINPSFVPLFFLYLIVITALLFFICWKTGEKPEGYKPHQEEDNQ